MAKGENIFRRRDGRWEARYVKGHDFSGKIKYGFCYGKTYREAKEKVTKCKAAIISGKALPSAGDRRRFAFYCDEWLRMRKTRIKESTYIKYETNLEKYIKPRLGECFPLGITTGIIDDFAKELLFVEELSPKTVHDILVELNGILKHTAAVYPGIFPAVEIIYPKLSRRDMRVLSRDEQERFTAYLLTDMDACRFGLLLALFTGIRIGELCALQWGSISMKEKTIRIDAAMHRLRDTNETGNAKTRIVISTPKSSNSARTIPMTDLTAMLCEKMDPEDPEAFILTGTKTYMEPRTLQYRIKKYTHACGLEGVHCHTLRHTFATRAVEVGFEIKSLSEILGHASTSITLECYVHSSLELKRRNMSKLTAAGF